jgi:hypothetical protein
MVDLSTFNFIQISETSIGMEQVEGELGFIHVAQEPKVVEH